MDNLDSGLGNLAHDWNLVNALDLVHDDSRLRDNDGAILVVNLFDEISLFDRSHLRVALDDCHPCLEFPGLHADTSSIIKLALAVC